MPRQQVLVPHFETMQPAYVEPRSGGLIARMPECPTTMRLALVHCDDRLPRLCCREGPWTNGMTLREQVEELLPSWRSWYPSLFDAAADLGLIRARVCPPDSLLLSSRHAKIQTAAQEAHREQWGGGPKDENG